MRAQRGFTLLELLVATAIVVVIGVAATMVFGEAVNSREHVGNRASALAGLQRGFLLMQRDFEEIVARPARDEMGDVQSFLASTADGGVEFTRLGWINPLDTRQRGSVQRVRYRLVDGELRREYWDHPDRQAGSTPESSVLMTDVVSFRVQYLEKPANGDYTWQDDWPSSADLGQPPQFRRAPLAIAVEIETKYFGVIRRFFRVAANPWARDT